MRKRDSKKRKNKNAIGASIGVLVGLGIFIALIYLFVLNQGVGVLVSCDSNKIISVRNVPPPLMQMVQSKICEVNLKVYSIENVEICNLKEDILEIERKVVGCPGLKDYKGQDVIIVADFFDLDGGLKGSDTQTLQVMP